MRRPGAGRHGFPISAVMASGMLLVDALTTGQLDDLPEETFFLLARTGLLPAFSACGFHLWVALILTEKLAAPLVRLLPPGSLWRNRLRVLLRVSCALLFGKLVGWQSPFLRAFAYASLQAAAELFEIRADRKWLFTLSLLLAALFGRSGALGLLLSASGMAGLLLLRPRSFWTSALGPWLCSLPVLVWAHGLCPFLGPLWNLSFGLLLGWGLLPLGLAARLLRAAGLPCPALESWAAAWMERLLLLLEKLDSRFGLAFWVSPGRWLALLLAFLLALAFFRRRRKTAVALAGAAAATVLLFPRPTLAVLDVGQGDSLWMQSRAGSVLVDAGPPAFRAGAAPAALALERLGEGAVGDILLTHFDQDHRGGIASLLVRHPVRGALWVREEHLSLPSATKVLAAAEQASVPVRFLTDSRAPAGLRCWLAPFSRANDSCPLCLAGLLSGEKLLLTGDMGFSAEDWFTARLDPFPRADFLKVAHHGSKTSSSEAFLNLARAPTALISVGQRNRYHHPAPETLARLKNAGMEIARTDRDGTLAYYRLWQRGWNMALALRAHLAGAPFIEESMRGGLTEEPAGLGKPGTEASASRL